MGLIGQLIERRWQSLGDLDTLMDRAVGAIPSTVGLDVSPHSAMENPAVAACVGLISETIATFPLLVYERLTSGGKNRAPRHPLYSVLHDEVNSEMTAFEFWQCQVGHLCLWGNAYSEIERSDYGVKALWPLRPDRMTISRDNAGELYYVYRLPNGTTKGFLRSQIMHLRGLSSNGIVGYSPIMLAKDAIGLAMATERFGAAFFGSGSKPGGVLQAPQGTRLSKEAAERLKHDWEAMHQGLSNAHRVAILEEGITWQAIGIPPNDAQFLETRRYQMGEIARIFRVPPHMIGDVERSTSWGTGIEQQAMGFLTYTLQPWITRVEKRILQDLFAPADRSKYFAEFLTDGLLRSDAVTRAQTLQIWRQNGVINADEWRERENLNPLPDGQGQTYWMPANMTTTDAVATAQKLAEKQLAEPEPSQDDLATEASNETDNSPNQ